MAAPPDAPARIDDAELIERSRHRPDLFAVLYDRYQDAGQCSGLQAGGEGPRGKAPWGLSVP